MEFLNNPASLPELAFTHGGRFHADDVFSSALLRILRPDIKIYRGFQVPINFSGIVYDIGDGPFDHHAKGSPKRPNGVPYAAFGLLWKEYGHFFLSEVEAARFDDKFIQPLDLDDNTGCGNILSGAIGAFNPVWDSDANTDEAFFEAVEVAEKLLRHKLESLRAVERGKEMVTQELANMQDNIVVLARYAPWKPVLVPTPAEFVVFPSARGGYSVQCIPKDFNGKTGDKVPMPAGWRGQPVEKLRAISGVPGIKFCHASGFMATAETVEDARLICTKARAEHIRVTEERRRQQEQAAQNKQ